MNASQQALVKIAETIGEVRVQEAEDAVWVTWKRFNRANAPAGALTAFSAPWINGKVGPILAQRKGRYPHLVGYRDLVKELKTGYAVATGEMLVKAILGAVYHHTEKA